MFSLQKLDALSVQSYNAILPKPQWDYPDLLSNTLESLLQLQPHYDLSCYLKNPDDRNFMRLPIDASSVSLFQELQTLICSLFRMKWQDPLLVSLLVDLHLLKSQDHCQKLI